MNGMLCDLYNLVPRPSICCVICIASFPGLPTVQFLSLAVCKNGRGRPGMIYHMNDVSVYLGRQRGEEESPVERSHAHSTETQVVSYFQCHINVPPPHTHTHTHTHTQSADFEVCCIICTSVAVDQKTKKMVSTHITPPKSD